MLHVVGIGLDGVEGLTTKVRQIVETATLLIGSDRHLSYFPNHPAPRLILGDLKAVIEIIRDRLSNPLNLIIILVSGDPLFFGLGRLLLAEIPADNLIFHPHISSIQLAFNQIKIPWQDAKIISVHGRSLDELTQALKQNLEKIAILTDQNNTPAAIANLILGLELPIEYKIWICENLGSSDERVQCLSIAETQTQSFASLNIVVLIRQIDVDNHQQLNFPLKLDNLPLFGLADKDFLTFSDRPGLMTKREIRILILGELGLQPKQIIWDIGAGTGSVSIEIARLFPTSQIYAIEKTAAGMTLIEKNSQRFQVKNTRAIYGKAPEILEKLPKPQRIFIGGSGGNLTEILETCHQKIEKPGILVIALTTIEHLNIAITWMQQKNWKYQLLQVQLSKAIPIAQLSRFSPLNPITILTANP